MISTRSQYAIGIVFGAVVILGLLAADGLFAKNWLVRSSLHGPTQQMSDFGPPTRTLPPTQDAARTVVGEPLYVDVRVPTFFDVADVQAVFFGLPDEVARAARIGVEFGEGSGQIRFFEGGLLTKNVYDLDGRIVQGMFIHELRASIPLSDVPTPGNRLRVVLSLPGLVYADAPQITTFSVTASRTSLLEAVRNRFGL
ncbi:MAG: hypothetical protein AAB974_00770 [Patescibacteria group bacterium]